tara:strand:- start:471 stop:1445 length:975 start_codon:yes stop_codon:yes gene_type:complete
MRFKKMRKSSNITELKKLKKPELDYSNVNLQLEQIDKETAENYLRTNFDNNRKIRPSSVSKIVDDIRSGDFYLSWDCLAFNEMGQLVNGQHRLSAVVEADIPCRFYVLRNIDHATVKHFDSGNKRSQADRISVHGTPMHPKACAVLKSSFGEWSSNFTGKNKYGYTKYDDLIASYYTRHSQYFEQLEKGGYLRSKYQGNFVTAAFKIFLEMKVGKARFTEFPHGMDAYERSLFWLDLCADGKSKNHMIDYNTDQAPFRLKEKLLARKSLGKTMYGQESFKLVCTAGRHFMEGRSPNIKPSNLKADPFSLLRGLPATNDKWKNEI